MPMLSRSVTFFIFVCLLNAFVSVIASPSTLNATARNGTNYGEPPSIPVHLTVPEIASVDQSHTNVFGYCNETCFKTEKKKGVSCALVSSAGSLLSTNLGKEIDTYDFIMRSGWAPIRGYELHVGSRTDGRPAGANFNRTHPAYGHDGSERVQFVDCYSSGPGVPGQDERAINDRCEIVLKSYRIAFPTKNALSSSCVFGSFYTNISADGTVNLFPGVHHPSTTGFQQANFLGSVCDTLTLFGFSLSDSLNVEASQAGYGYHYYPDNRKMRRKLLTAEEDLLAAQEAVLNWHHDYTEERNFYQNRSLCTCRDGYTGVYFLDVDKMRPLPPSVKILKHDEITKGTSPGGIEAVRQLFRQLKTRP